MSSTARRQITALAIHEYRAATRSRVLAALVAVMVATTTISIIVGAVDYNSQLADYRSYLDAARAGGITPNAPPPLKVLALTRGAFEYLEILGAMIAIVLGYLSVARDRTSRTLMLLHTRPITAARRAIGASLGALAIITTLVLATGAIAVVSLGLVAGDWPSASELLRLSLALLATIPYLGAFYCLGVILTMRAKTLANGLVAALVVWLVVVLVLPQIGDTMDPDNQVPGGLFSALGVDKPIEEKILADFSTYETVRNDIEEASLSKHYERFAFGMTDVKEKYHGFTLDQLLHEKRHDIWWLGAYAVLLGAMLARSYQRQPTLPTGGTSS